MKEIERKLNPKLITLAGAHNRKSRKAKDIVILMLDDFNVFADMESFLSKYYNMNVVIVGDSILFQKSLFNKLSKSGCETLCKERKLHIGDCWLHVSGTGFDYFNTVKGNSWGSIWNIDEQGTQKEISDFYDNTIDACWNAGWQIDRLMPPSLMANNLFNRTVDARQLLDIKQIDFQELYFAFQCIKPPIMEAASLGKPRGKVFDYDINWANPYAMTQVPSYDMTNFNHVHSSTYQKEAIEGFINANVYLRPKIGIGVLPIRAGFSDKYHCYNPIGSFTGFWTKRQLDLITEYQLGEYDIIDAWWIIPKSSYIPYPFRGMVKTIGKLRDNEETKDFAKSISPTLWGKFASSYGSPYFNPLYAATVVSVVSDIVMSKAVFHTKELIAITADGFAMRQKLDDVEITKNIGDMKVAERNNFISVHDYYRDYDNNDRSWELTNDGILIKGMRSSLESIMESNGDFEDIGKALPEQKIGYGSTKRVGTPKGLTLHALENDFFEITPPNAADIVDLFLNQKEDILWESRWFKDA